MIRILKSIICYFKGHDIDYCIGCNPDHIRIGKHGIMIICMRCGKVVPFDPGVN